MSAPLRDPHLTAVYSRAELRALLVVPAWTLTAGAVLADMERHHDHAYLCSCSQYGGAQGRERCVSRAMLHRAIMGLGALDL